MMDMYTNMEMCCGEEYASKRKWCEIGMYVVGPDQACGKIVLARYKEGEVGDCKAHLAVARIDGYTEHYHYSPEHLEKVWRRLDRFTCYHFFERNLIGKEIVIREDDVETFELITSVRYSRGKVVINGRDEADLWRKAYFLHPSGTLIPVGLPLIGQDGKLEQPIGLWDKRESAEGCEE